MHSQPFLGFLVVLFFTKAVSLACFFGAFLSASCVDTSCMNPSFAPYAHLWDNPLCAFVGQPSVILFSYTHAQDPLEHQAEALAAQVPLGPLAEGGEVPADAAVEPAEEAGEVGVCWAWSQRMLLEISLSILCYSLLLFFIRTLFCQETFLCGLLFIVLSFGTF